MCTKVKVKSDVGRGVIAAEKVLLSAARSS